MAEKISIQIALEGGAEIEKQLEGIGEAGQKAFADITKSAEQVGGFKELKPDEVTKKLQEMGVTGVDSIKKIQDAVASAGRLETLVQGIASVEAGFAALARAAPGIGVAIVAGVTAATKATIAFAAEINKVNDTAIKLGVGVQQLDQFRAGLEAAGVSAKSVGEILQSKLATEQGVAGLESFIRQLQQMPDSLERSRAATQQFGAAGSELIRILQAGGKLTGFGPPGGLINADDAKKATELGQALNRLEAAINRLGSVQIAPQLTTGINVVTQLVQQLGAQLEAVPWSTFVAGAQAASSPVAAVFTALLARITAVGPAAQQAGQDVTTMFTQWGTAAKQGADTASAAIQQTTTLFTSFGTVAEQTGAKAAQAGQTAASGWDVFLAKLDEIARKAGTILGGGAPAAAGGGQFAGGGLLGGRGSGTSDSNLAWLSRGEFVVQAAAVRKYGAGLFAALNAQRFAGGGLVGGGGTSTLTGSGGIDQLVQAIETNTEAVKSQSTVIIELGRIVEGIVQIVGELVQSVTRLADQQAELMKSISAVMDRAGGKASGGLLGGRGSGTSDSNLAWVSRGEHIMPARAVAQPGVLAFLEALRRSGGNLSRVLDGMGRFAMGGMVPRMPAMAFAGGGMVGGGNLGTLTLVTANGIVSGLTDAKIAEALGRVAVKGQVTSGGRKPSRYS